jgi:hypothetical protein
MWVLLRPEAVAISTECTRIVRSSAVFSLPRSWPAQRLRLPDDGALELRPDAGKGRERPVVVKREPDHVFLFGLWVRLRRIFCKAVEGHQATAFRLQPTAPAPSRKGVSSRRGLITASPANDRLTVPRNAISLRPEGSQRQFQEGGSRSDCSFVSIGVRSISARLLGKPAS